MTPACYACVTRAESVVTDSNDVKELLTANVIKLTEGVKTQRRSTRLQGKANDVDPALTRAGETGSENPVLVTSSPDADASPHLPRLLQRLLTMFSCNISNFNPTELSISP